MRYDIKNTWLISDTHFGHYNMIKLSGRPLNFNEKIINNWTRKIKPDDQVLHLGDLSIFFGPTRDMWADMAASLPGKKDMIRGNHDKEEVGYYLMRGITIIRPLILSVDGKQVVFTHQPEDPAKGFDINIHGHMHGNTHHQYPFEMDRHIDISCEVMDYTPVKIGDLL